MATIYDIANHCGVSAATVSLVMNGSRRKISPLTRTRVQDAAQLLNYRANASARNLQTGRTLCVAFITMRSSPGPVAPGRKPGIEICSELLADAGYETRIMSYSDQEAALEGLRSIAFSRSADLVVIWSQTVNYVREQAELAQDLKLKFVVFGRFEDDCPLWPQVDFDHEGMTRSSVDYLWARGHRNIAYVSYDTELPYCVRLLKGYRDTLENLGGKPVPDDFIFRSRENPETRDIWRTQMSRLMSLPFNQRPTAIVMGVDSSAWLDLEILLLDYGYFIGPEANEIEVSGLAYRNGNLAFGNAVVCGPINDTMIAEEMMRRLVLPLMRGEFVTEPVVRFLPGLASHVSSMLNKAQRDRFVRI